LINGWLLCIDSDRVHIQIFNLGLIEDAITVQARARAEFIECKDRSLSECVQEIRNRGIDVLLYPEVGMDLMTLQLAGLRLAPHQVAAWGHPETTGLPTIDCYVSAAAFEPADAQSNYSEKLIRLSNLGCYYEPYGLAGTAPDLEALGIAPDVPLLLCSGTPFKYGAEHDDLLVDIASELVRCQIVLFEARPRSLSARLLARLRGRFHQAGLDPDRYLVMVPWQSPEAFFGLMRYATVYLDSPGFSGFNTVMQAVECELPVVAFEGQFMRGRFASAILRRMQLTELVALDSAQYVQHVARLVGDREFHSGVRARLRSGRQLLYRDCGPVKELTEWVVTLAAGPTGWRANDDNTSPIR
jgi:predicted O-linked N-acetylglucosamine transferase (SPINDLY family)